MTLDRLEDRPGQVMLLQQAPEVEQRGGIRGPLPAQIDPDKGPDRLTVVHRVLGGLVGQPEKLLHDIHAQHELKPDWRAATLAFRVERLDLLDQQRSRRRRVDLVQKSLPARPPLLGGELQLGKAHLVHALASGLPGHHYPIDTRRRHSIGHSGAKLNQRFPNGRWR